ncbi:TetR/AcrR family transcriptional regulator [Kribbella sp. CA-245084]|uniref:TetR/AcrR family transcriptional regulator n=1 Tax=Kribbella sp. CA-245084 TaxID=3239940 RepID=UPI003D8B5559
MVSHIDERRTDTRQQIRAVALELFAERGYGQTSLREIAERLGVTKAAVYYHYRTKEDILSSLLDELIAGVDRIIECGQAQPSGPERRREVLERYSEMLTDTFEEAPRLVRFLQESQTSIKDLAAGAGMRERFHRLRALLIEPDAAVEDEIRAQVALLALHVGAFPLAGTEDVVETDRADRGAAALRVALAVVNGDEPVSRG